MQTDQSAHPEDTQTLKAPSDFSNIAMPFEEAILKDQGPSDALENSLDFNRAKFYVERLGHCLTPGRMLDLKAGCGIRMVGFRNQGWQVEGVEPELELNQLSRDKFQLNLHSETSLAFQTQRRYELVISCNIIDDEEHSEEMTAHIVSLIARDGYALIEHKRTPRSQKQGKNVRQQLAETDSLFNQQGFARVDWGHAPRETRSELLKAALRNPQGHGSLSRLLTLPMQWVPDGIDVRLPHGDCLWSLYQKAGHDDL